VKYIIKEEKRTKTWGINQIHVKENTQDKPTKKFKSKETYGVKTYYKSRLQ